MADQESPRLVPVPERLGSSLQENLLTLLVHSEEHGRVVADMVDPALFEGDYRVIAERAVDYWRRYKRPPGPHMSDLLSDILESKNDRRAGTYRSVLIEMLRLSEAINAKYAVDSLRAFVRVQKFQTAMVETMRKIQAQRELALPEVEEMWADLLRVRDATLDRGASLNDIDRLVDFLRNTAVEFTTGIDELDRRHIAPMRAAVFLLIAATGVGKSWGLIHLGKRALMQRKKVLHVSLEMSEEEVLMRYYQAFFGVPDREAKDATLVTTLEKDAMGRLSAIEREEVVPEFSLDSENLEDELATRRALMEGKFKNIEIKRFPTRGLTVNQLRAYMDSLEAAGFVPDVLVLDYIGIMKTDPKDHRISLGRTFEDFRGLCVERNVAGVTAQQLGRDAAKTGRGGQTNVAEDWSLIGTADVCVSLNATDAEKRYGLARLFVDKARRARDKFGVLLTQNYDIGQFVLDSVPLDERRYDALFDRKAEEGEDDGDDE